MEDKDEFVYGPKDENRPFVYVAIPYSHKDPDIQKYRFDMANAFSAQLMNEGMNVFSPVSMGHPIAIAHDLPENWEYWQGLCEAALSCTYKMYVLCIEGWEESTGVQAEIEICKRDGIRIAYVYVPQR
jgi:hypothetical protein